MKRSIIPMIMVVLSIIKYYYHLRVDTIYYIIPSINKLQFIGSSKETTWFVPMQLHCINKSFCVYTVVNCYINIAITKLTTLYYIVLLLTTSYAVCTLLFLGQVWVSKAVRVRYGGVTTTLNVLVTTDLSCCILFFQFIGLQDILQLGPEFPQEHNYV